MTFERGRNSGSVLSFGYVYNKYEIACGNVAFSRVPFGFGEGRAAVTGCDLQTKLVESIDLVFSPPERREQAGSYIKDGYLHS